MRGAGALTPSVPEAIEGILRERILAGDLAADEALREAALAEEFEVSRHTIREALLLLDRAGLVQKRNHRGSRVTVPDTDHLRDVMAFRRTVEPGALRTIGAGHPVLTELRALAVELEGAARAGDWAGYGELDRAFHTALVAAGGSPRLTEAFGRVIDELRLHFNELDQSQPLDTADHVSEHGALVWSLARGDHEVALTILDEHLREAERRLLEG